jgi:hypothetical protein
MAYRVCCCDTLEESDETPPLVEMRWESIIRDEDNVWCVEIRNGIDTRFIC